MTYDVHTHVHVHIYIELTGLTQLSLSGPKEEDFPISKFRSLTLSLWFLEQDPDVVQLWHSGVGERERETVYSIKKPKCQWI